jgi:capsular polysaccharide biosynthesis protein
MQLRRYGAVVRRRWRVIALVVALVAIGGGWLTLAPSRVQYTAEVQLLLNRTPNQPATATPDFRFDDYYRFLATEYVLDDLVEQVRGNMFALAVLERLHSRGVFEFTTDEQIQRSLKPERAHRILTIEAVAPTRELALALTRAVEETLIASPEVTQPPDGSKINVKTIHRDPQARSNWQRTLLTYALQLALALLLGIGLAFLLDYLDDRVRDADDAAALGAPLLGRLPAGAARAR